MLSLIKHEFLLILGYFYCHWFLYEFKHKNLITIFLGSVTSAADARQISEHV